MRSAEVVYIFRASFCVLQKDLGWIEWMAELALARDAMLEAFLVNLDLFVFGVQIIKSILLLRHRLAQLLVRFLQHAVIFQFVWSQLVVVLVLICFRSLRLLVLFFVFLVDGVHQLLVHLPIILKLWLKILLLFSPFLLLLPYLFFVQLDYLLQLCLILLLQFFYVPLPLLVVLPNS